MGNYIAPLAGLSGTYANHDGPVPFGTVVTIHQPPVVADPNNLLVTYVGPDTGPRTTRVNAADVEWISPSVESLTPYIVALTGYARITAEHLRGYQGEADRLADALRDAVNEDEWDGYQGFVDTWNAASRHIDLLPLVRKYEVTITGYVNVPFEATIAVTATDEDSACEEAKATFYDDPDTFGEVDGYQPDWLDASIESIDAAEA